VDDKNDIAIKTAIDEMVNDPDKGIVFIDKMTEKELLDLLMRLAKKAKSIRSRHWLRYGVLLEMGKVLSKIYSMNIHRWAIDDGMSREEIEGFEKHFKDKLFGDFLRTNELIIDLLRNKKDAKP